MIKETITQHEKCIEILEAIQHFQAMIQHKNDSINVFGGSFKDLRNKYTDNIDKYLIESTIVIPTTILSKTIINIFFKFYKSRRPIHTKYSYEEAREAIGKTITQFTKN